MRNGQLLCGFWMVGLLVSTLNSTQGAEAATSAPDTSKDLPTRQEPASIWKDGVGSGLRSGTLNVGVTTGIALGMDILGSNDRHDMALAMIEYGCIITNPLAPERWYGGNFELGLELAAGGQFHPEGAYVVGLMPSLRYHFMTGSAWVPFVEAGAGPAITDIGLPDLSTEFQFMDYFGTGVNWFYNETDVISGGVRFIHLSNASLQEPNFGVNTCMVFLGWKHYF